MQGHFLRQDAVHAPGYHLLAHFKAVHGAHLLALHQLIGVRQTGVQQDHAARPVGDVIKGGLQIPPGDLPGHGVAALHHAAQKEFHGLRRVQKAGQVQKSVYRRVIAPQPFPIHSRAIGAHGGQQRLLQRGGQGQIPVVPFRPKAAPQAAQKRLRRAQIVPVGQQQLSVVDE